MMHFMRLSLKLMTTFLDLSMLYWLKLQAEESVFLIEFELELANQRALLKEHKAKTLSNTVTSNRKAKLI